VGTSRQVVYVKGDISSCRCKGGKRSLKKTKGEKERGEQLKKKNVPRSEKSVFHSDGKKKEKGTCLPSKGGGASERIEGQRKNRQTKSDWY